MFARSFAGRSFSTFAFAIVAAAGVAHAQVQPVTPYYAVVSGDAGTLRSAPTSNAYSVATIPTGAVVIVDGETQGWTRVLYPAGLHAFVPATAGTVQGETVTLAAPEELFAASQLKGWGGSWKGLLDQPLPAGATLTLVEVVKDGEIALAYKVIAPNEARGYVGASSVRRATDTEVEAYRSKGNAIAALPATAAPVSTGGGTAQPTAIDLPAGYTQETRPVTIKRPEAPASTTTPNTVLPGANTTANTTTTPGSGTTPPGTQTTAVVETKAESLEKTFLRVWKEPVLSAEVDELIGEYERAIPQEALDTRKTAMNRRVEALKLRRDYRESLRRLEADRNVVDARQTELNQQLEEWASNRVYTIVGVLQPSTVYDGLRLPSMYRVVSVGGNSPRTLGYIRKTEGLDLDKHLGLIVGVIGDRTLDPSLQLNMISPVRVDPLRSPATLDVPMATRPSHTQPTTTQVDDTK